MSYKPTIGLEIHAELKTKTKMFCNSKNDPDEKAPNLNICPVCMAHPGTLPKINKEAVKSVLKVGVALGGSVADYTEFDRKNYFYPDLPKGYQISQYEFPLVSGGELCDVRITRIHLEEDTARSIHTNDKRHSFVDFNRSGIPLMELVTEPEIKDASHAGRFARELQLLLRYLNVSNANMEKGEMRVEANISISKEANILGTKVEIKNLNSFKSVEKAIDYEIKRQIHIIERGDDIIQETRGWDEDKGTTFSQRIKEMASDYRYFPDPDLPKLKLSLEGEFCIESLRSEMPILPREIREIYKKEFLMKEKDIEIYINNENLRLFFEKVVKEFHKDEDKNKKILLASNYIINNLSGTENKGKKSTFNLSAINPSDFAVVIRSLFYDKISSNSVVDIVNSLLSDSSIDVTQLISQYLQESDENELLALVDTIIRENSSVADEYRFGKESALQFLIGQGMKATKGKANPAKLSSLLKKVLLRE